MSWYELSHELGVAKGRVVTNVEKPKELMVVGHLDEIAEKWSIA